MVLKDNVVVYSKRTLQIHNVTHCSVKGSYVHLSLISAAKGRAIPTNCNVGKNDFSSGNLVVIKGIMGQDHLK